MPTTPAAPAGAQPPSTPVHKQQWEPWFKIFLGVAGAAALTLAAIQFWPGTSPTEILRQHIVKEAEAATITLTATKEDKTGVTADTAFQLVAEDGTLNIEMVKEKLKLKPDVAFTVTSQDSDTFLITPDQPLAAKTVYTASFDGQAKTTDGQREPRLYSWAFQVRNEFAVLGSYPRNQATSVPASSGIEVTFTVPGVTAGEFANHFSVTPKTEGTFEVHQRTIVFVPKEPLKEKSLYTMTVRKGLRPTGGEQELADDFVWRFEVAPAKGDDMYGYRLIPSDYFETVRPNEPIIFSNFAASRYNPKTKKQEPSEYEFTIYRYRNNNDWQTAVSEAMAQSMPWAYYANASYIYETANLQKVATVKTKSENGILSLPSGFEAGVYLADSNSYGVNSQLPFMVTEVSGYAMTTETDTLVWVNDLSTGQPVNAATVSGPNDLRVTTDEQGVARFTTPPVLVDGTTTAALLAVTFGSKSTYFVAHGQPKYRQNIYGRFGSNAAEDYWAFLGTDRSIYQPSDTIHFWGVARPRIGGAVTGQLSVQLVSLTYDTRYAEQVVADIPLTITADGTFLGQMVLHDLPVGGSQVLRLKSDDAIIVSRYLDVQTYRRPAYQVTLTPNRFAVISGERVTYTIQTQFFDGTPVTNVQLKFSAGDEESITTDSNGMASREVTTSDNSGGSAYASPVDDATGNISGSTYVQVYPASIEITATSNQVKDTKATVSGTVRNLHPDRADPTLPDPLAPVIGDPRPNQEVTGRLIALLYDKIPTGQYYDFLGKEVVQTYRYESRREVRETFTLKTNDVGTFTQTLTIDPDTRYQVELEASDSQARVTRCQRGVNMSASPCYEYVRIIGFGTRVGMSLS